MNNAEVKLPQNIAQNQNYEQRTTDDDLVDSGRLRVEPNLVDKGSSAVPRKGGVKPKGQVTSSWTLRSKSREKPKAPEPSGTVKEGNPVVEKKRVKQNRKSRKITGSNEFSSKKSRLRYLLHRIKYEQNLIDAYTAEGWKGQSLEKLKPEKELQRAQSHILHYKLKIRALFQQMDQSLSLGKIPEALFDAEGEIDSEDIFCAKCASKDVTLNNDIILCDGSCERGFHQYCLEPPLAKEDIPQGDEAWLCPGCDCKADCFDILKDFLGTKLSILDSWEKIFPEAATGKDPGDGLGSSSDDSEDDDFDPEKPNSEEVEEEEDLSSSDDSSYYSASNDMDPPSTDDKNLILPSDDSEDDDFDPSAPDPEVQSKTDSSSSDFTSDSEDLGALLDDAAMSGEDKSSNSQSSDEQSLRGCELGKMNRKSLQNELSYLVETSGEPVTAKRHVNQLDYKKLNDFLSGSSLKKFQLLETFGNQSSDSSDEDFEDDTSRKRRRIKHDRNESAPAYATPKTNVDSKAKNPRQKKQDNVDSASTSTKRSKQRLDEAAKQRLNEAFNENHYPEKSVRDNLAKELGITTNKVCKWFGHARWNFRHNQKTGSDITEKSHMAQPTTTTTSTDNIILDQNANNEILSAIPAKISRNVRGKKNRALDETHK